MDFAKARFGRRCCREIIRAALHRLDLSWTKAGRLTSMRLGSATPKRRDAVIEQVRLLLDGAQCDRHQPIYLDEAASARMLIPAADGASAARRT